MILFLLSLFLSPLDVERAICAHEHIRVSRELGELISLRATLLRLSPTAEMLRKDTGAPTELIEAQKTKPRADEGGGNPDGDAPPVQLAIHPLFYSQLPVGLKARPLGEHRYELTVLWLDVSAARTEQNLKIVIDTQARTVAVSSPTRDGNPKVEVEKSGLRVVLPTRVQLFINWPCPGSSEVLVWNGCARHRVRLGDGAVTSAPVIDAELALPAGCTDLTRVPTLLALCDGSVRDLRQGPHPPTLLAPVDVLVWESFSEWGDDPTGGRTEWQRRLLKALARLEAVDDEARARSVTATGRLKLAERRAAVARDLVKEMAPLDQAVTDTALRLARLRNRLDALKRETAVRVHRSWLDESREVDKLLDTLRQPAARPQP